MIYYIMLLYTKINIYMYIFYDFKEAINKIIMVKLIYFGKFNYKIIYPILTGLAAIILHILKQLVDNLNKEKEKKMELTYGNHRIVYIWIMFLGESCAIFFNHPKQWLFPNHGLYKKMKNKTPNKMKAMIIHIFFYFCLALFDLSGSIIDLATDSSEAYLTDELFLIVRFFLYLIFCKILLKYKYYNHHAVGAGFIILGTILNAFMNTSQDFKISFFLYCFANFFVFLCESIQNTLEKYLMDNHFFDPFMLLAGEGLSGLFLTSIILLVGNYITCPENRYGICMDKGKQVDDFAEAMTFLWNNKDYGLLYLLLFITVLFYNIVKMLMNQHFTPLHRNIAKDLRNFGCFFLQYTSLDGRNENINILEIGTYIVMFIGDLIFLEFIILNFFGLNKNTQLEVIKRESEDNSVRYLLEKESFSSLVSDE